MMSKWMLSAIAALTSLLVHSGEMPESIKSELEKAAEYGTFIIPLLNEISADWEFESLTPHLAQFAYDSEEKISLIKQMLENVSHVGRFKACNNLKTGTLNGFKIKNNTAVNGICEFEKGRAEVTFVFTKNSEKYDVLLFMIFPQ